MNGMTQGFGHTSQLILHLAGSPTGAIRAAPNDLQKQKRVTTAGGGIFFCWFGVGRYEKTMPGDAIVENNRLFDQPEVMFLYLHNDCTIGGNI